ncbi:hypothetical protein B0G74_8988 [Paraburkholderia sp. BL9I2N2]|nr:hypothetical protein B0G74_8988 [Paraburkholderia sp. BL9I2N2]
MCTFYLTALAAAALATTTATALATPFTAYTTTVHLRDGKQAVCAVNEPHSTQSPGAQTLSTVERNEAQIDATARLRRHLGNKNRYPSPATAPLVNCT